MTEAYLELSQTSTMELLLQKKLRGKSRYLFFLKSSIVDVSLGSTPLYEMPN